MRSLPTIATGLLAVGLIAAALPWVPLRQLIIAASLITAPGIAIASLAGIRDSLVLAVIVLPAGIAINSLTASAFVYVGAWSTELIYAAVGIITVAAAWLGTRRRTAQVGLVGIATLPAVLLIVAQLSRGAP